MVLYFKAKEKVGIYNKGCTIRLECNALGMPVDPVWLQRMVEQKITVKTLIQWR